MSDCPFCPHNWRNLDVVRTGTGTLVINPLDPVVDGHVLVIGHAHNASAAVDPVQAGRLMETAAQYVRRQGIEANIITSIGPAATQTIRHTHVHVVPRRPGDGLTLPWTGQKKRDLPARVAPLTETPDYGSLAAMYPDIVTVPFPDLSDHVQALLDEGSGNMDDPLEDGEYVRERRDCPSCGWAIVIERRDAAGRTTRFRGRKDTEFKIRQHISAFHPEMLHQLEQDAIVPDTTTNPPPKD